MKLRKIFAHSARPPFGPCSLLPAMSAGFTLLEVVVAMTIVGLGVVTLLEIFSLGLRLGARSSVRTAGISYGRQALDEILSRRQIRDGTEEGAVNEMHRWKLQVEPVKDLRHSLSLSSDWELKEITLDMRVQEAGRESRVELRTLRLIKKNKP